MRTTLAAKTHATAATKSESPRASERRHQMVRKTMPAMTARSELMPLHASSIKSGRSASRITLPSRR